jgi:hypothetical protein
MQLFSLRILFAININLPLRHVSVIAQIDAELIEKSDIFLLTVIKMRLLTYIFQIQYEGNSLKIERKKVKFKPF